LNYEQQIQTNIIQSGSEEVGLKRFQHIVHTSSI